MMMMLVFLVITFDWRTRFSSSFQSDKAKVKKDPLKAFWWLPWWNWHPKMSFVASICKTRFSFLRRRSACRCRFTVLQCLHAFNDRCFCFRQQRYQTKSFWQLPPKWTFKKRHQYLLNCHFWCTYFIKLWKKSWIIWDRFFYTIFFYKIWHYQHQKMVYTLKI